ncbi:MAG: UDP-3-O-[3-hydroxymyristoyl] N-acetylglucosamine deacetylase [Nitrospirae bacterium]|nr:UDP-3-O-[3-hydroxymyristoyl] N-acetylglucosamine deacetylase [Nitrospirota bacterium]
MRTQRTIKDCIYFEGVGLHTGAYCKVTLHPAPVDTGIVFYRPCKKASLSANINTVVDTTYATTIGNERLKVRTVEHLLAVVSAMGITNLTIEVEGPEIPILDGSAHEIAKLVWDTGLRKQKKSMPYIKVLQPVVLEDDHGKVAAYPYDGRKITFRLFFKNHFLGEQLASFDIDRGSFVNEIAPARTFGFLKDVEYFRANGLAKGGSLDNALIFSETAVINESGLRFRDECVRHKILDSIGDFSLIGLPIEGHIVADKSGHTMNIKFLNKLLACSDCWEVVSDQVVEKTPIPVFSYSYT